MPAHKKKKAVRKKKATYTKYGKKKVVRKKKAQYGSNMQQGAKPLAKKGKRLDIKKAIKKPGALTAAAKRKGMSIAQYCKNPPGRKATQRCNFAKTLKKITNRNKKKK
jgi:hypothetical protein|tara:strand:+ start:2739 stop:3062 length:324 start_codon:yes stop_codon:yes gene_type:complete